MKFEFDSVESAGHMFANATKYGQPASSLTAPKVKYANYMFYKCDLFDFTNYESDTIV